MTTIDFRMIQFCGKNNNLALNCNVSLINNKLSKSTITLQKLID